MELKAVKALEDVHFAQVRSYLKATGLHVGLLMNFCASYAGSKTNRAVTGEGRNHESTREGKREERTQGLAEPWVRLAELRGNDMANSLEMDE